MIWNNYLELIWKHCNSQNISEWFGTKINFWASTQENVHTYIVTKAAHNTSVKFPHDHCTYACDVNCWMWFALYLVHQKDTYTLQKMCGTTSCNKCVIKFSLFFRCYWDFEGEQYKHVKMNKLDGAYPWMVYLSLWIVLFFPSNIKSCITHSKRNKELFIFQISLQKSSA